ncbi:MAG: alpha/beta hydrolase [Verrucomicrobiota bacterium]
MKKRLLTLHLLAFIHAITLPWIAYSDEIDWARARELRHNERSGVPLTQEERIYLDQAKAARMNSQATDGDGSNEVATVAQVTVSEDDSPVNTVSAKASDGHEIKFAYRSPKADRPLPAFVFIHGSLGQRRIRELSENLRTNPTQTRFLAAGFVTVAATFRTYGDEPLSRGPILDLQAIIEETRKLSEVDPESVIIFGTSGGGSIALELAANESDSFPAVIIGEPASILFTGMMTDLSMREKSMRDYASLYTAERKTRTEEKISRISSPLLIHHGDVHPLRKINFEILFPAIEAAGKSLLVKTYPGEDHGFYWGNRTTEKTVEAVVQSTLDFVETRINTRPSPILTEQ